VNARWNRWVSGAQNTLLLLTLAGIVYYFAHDIKGRAMGTDFPDRYSAGRMVLEGYGHQLYDVHTQEQFQIRYAGRTGEYYIHPPFETLLFLPLCLFSLPTAYLLWCILNIGVLAYTAIVFQRHVLKRWDWRVLLPLFFLFPPVLIDFSQGQDALLMLLIMTLGFVELKRDRNFAAGCLLGCGLFKFHIVLTLVALVASLGKKGFLRGFALVLVILLLISAGISGWSFLAVYPRFLVSLSSLPSGNIHPAAMANIRGLIRISGAVPGTLPRLAVVWIGSGLLFCHAWRSFKSQSKFADATNLAFGNFVLAAILISYHSSPADLCIVLLPIGLFSHYLAEHSGIPRWARLTLLISQGVLVLPPLHLILLVSHAYAYAAIPVLVMFFLTASRVFVETGFAPSPSAAGDAASRV
jgi:hypothetical protein